MFEVDFKILNQKSTPAIYADTLALRPSPGFVGRLFVATDSPYGVFRDTGTAWVQVASNGGGGGGSTGVNGLNGTTNIGLGGTLTGNTTITGSGIYNLILGVLGSDRIAQLKSHSIFLDLVNTNSGYTSNITIDQNYLNLKFNDDSSFFNSNIYIDSTKIFTSYNNTSSIDNYGLNLNFANQIFGLGDFDFTIGKKNSIIVNDNLSKIYFTTGRSTSNVDPDLLYAENTSSSVRVVKLGDFGNFNNQTSLQVNDGGNIIFTTTTIGNNGIYITNQNAILGSQNSLGYLFINCDYTNNIISTFNTSSVDTGLKLNFNNDIYTLGGFNSGGNIIEINDDPAFNQIKFETSTLIFNGAALEDPTPGAVATKALLITLNGTQYKINLY